MDVILIWTIWATAFTSPIEMDQLERMCRATHPQGRLSVSREVLSWNERHYPAAMFICSRPGAAESSEDSQPEAIVPSVTKQPV